MYCVRWSETVYVYNKINFNKLNVVVKIKKREKKILISGHECFSVTLEIDLHQWRKKLYVTRFLFHKKDLRQFRVLKRAEKRYKHLKVTGVQSSVMTIHFTVLLQFHQCTVLTNVSLFEPRLSWPLEEIRKIISWVQAIRDFCTLDIVLCIFKKYIQIGICEMKKWSSILCLDHK